MRKLHFQLFLNTKEYKRRPLNLKLVAWIREVVYYFILTIKTQQKAENRAKISLGLLGIDIVMSR